MQAVDYSFSRPNPADLASAGYVGALRYLCPLPNAKAVTGDEIASLHANNLAIGFVWESGASRAGNGESAGRADGYAANDQADHLGVPDTITLYFAVDYDADPAAVTAYFQGVHDVSKRPVGAYGSFRVVEHLLDAGLVARAWQTVAWSRGQRSSRAVLFQRADAAANPPPGTDVNDILQDDWGQWSPNGGSNDMDAQEFHDKVLGGDPQVNGTATWADVIKLTAELARDNAAKLDAIIAKLDGQSGPVGAGIHGDVQATIHFP